MDYGLWIMDYGLWIMDYGLWIFSLEVLLRFECFSIVRSYILSSIR
jgi:hypothetical protein